MIATRFLCLAAFVMCLGFNTAYGVAADFTTYEVQPGSMYTYKPSPWIGIPGGQPSEFQLDFGVAGTFTVEYDRTADTARLLSVELVLTGNEAIQAAPPNAFTPVTADRVEDWLEARLFHNEFVAAPLDQYEEETHQSFHLLDYLGVSVDLDGGYDGTFVDGNAMLFNVSAVRIPEPTAVAISGCGALSLLALRRRHAA